MHVGEVLRSRRQNDAVSRTGTKKAITRVPSVRLLIWINPPIRFPCRRILIYISGLLATIRFVGIIRIRTPPFLAERLKDRVASWAVVEGGVADGAVHVNLNAVRQREAVDDRVVVQCSGFVYFDRAPADGSLTRFG